METASISVGLTIVQWNYVLNVLGDRPYKETAELIKLIKDQAEAQIANLPKPEAPASDAEAQ